MERVKGIEPSSQAWEAHVLPLNHTRRRMCMLFSRGSGGTQMESGSSSKFRSSNFSIDGTVNARMFYRHGKTKNPYKDSTEDCGLHPDLCAGHGLSANAQGNCEAL